MQNSNPEEPRLRDTFKEDFRRKDLFQTLRSEFNELTQYFLTDKRKAELERMSVIKRYFYLFWWLLKTLFLRLTPLRRVLVLIGVVMIGTSGNVVVNDVVFFSNNGHIFGGLILLYVLMLELKDKLLAKTELQEGKAVQKALMPDSNPEIPGWDVYMNSIPANDVGGDLIDYFKIDDFRYAAILGDISGKGLGAALMMSKLQSTIRALYSHFTEPAELIQAVNKIFCRDSLPHQFASLVYVEINAGEDKLKIVNAGHIPPLIIDGKEIHSLAKGGIAIGLSPISKYEAMEVSLEVGSELVVYSDGVTETMNEHHAQFGEERLKRFLSSYAPLTPSDQVGKILYNLNVFKGDAPIHDDISIMILKKNDSAGKR